MFVELIFSLNLASPFSKLLPVAPANDPESTWGKLPVYWSLAAPLLSKYCGVGEFTALI